MKTENARIEEDCSTAETNEEGMTWEDEYEAIIQEEKCTEQNNSLIENKGNEGESLTTAPVAASLDCTPSRLLDKSISSNAPNTDSISAANNTASKSQNMLIISGRPNLAHPYVGPVGKKYIKAHYKLYSRSKGGAERDLLHGYHMITRTGLGDIFPLRPPSKKLPTTHLRLPDPSLLDVPSSGTTVAAKKTELQLHVNNFSYRFTFIPNRLNDECLIDVERKGYYRDSSDVMNGCTVKVLCAGKEYFMRLPLKCKEKTLFFLVSVVPLLVIPVTTSHSVVVAWVFPLRAHRSC